MNKLRPKYQVRKIIGDAPKGVYGLEDKVYLSTDPDDPDSPFVLMPRKDPAAFVAMIAYARHCEQDLANEIKAWLRKIAEAEPVYGTQGTRNLRAVKVKGLQDIL